MNSIFPHSVLRLFMFIFQICTSNGFFLLFIGKKVAFSFVFLFYKSRFYSFVDAKNDNYRALKSVSSMKNRINYLINKTCFVNCWCFPCTNTSHHVDGRTFGRDSIAFLMCFSFSFLLQNDFLLAYVVLYAASQVIKQ